MKTYNNKDVYTAAKERIEYIFDEFEHICISFSGGKDSGTVLNMCIDEARKRKRIFRTRKKAHLRRDALLSA